MQTKWKLNKLWLRQNCSFDTVVLNHNNIYSIATQPPYSYNVTNRAEQRGMEDIHSNIVDPPHYSRIRYTLHTNFKYPHLFHSP